MPKDEEINWEKTPEARYVWVEQVAETETPNQPIAVNKRGQILFGGLGEMTGTSTSLLKSLWDSSIKDWKPLPINGSSQTITPKVNQLIAINDEGLVTGRSVETSELAAPGIPYPVDNRAGMLWKEDNSTPPVYISLKYFMPEEAWETDNRQYGITEVGGIGKNGEVNCFSYLRDENLNTVYNWDLYLSAGETENTHTISPLASNETGMPGAVYDSNHCLFIHRDGSSTSTNAGALYYWNGLQKSTVTGLLLDESPQRIKTSLSTLPGTLNSNSPRVWLSATGTTSAVRIETWKPDKDRWQQITSMAEGAIRLNAQGLAITRGRTDANGVPITPPKLWRNGKYTNLNDENLTGKPSGVIITEAIDLASNGIILAKATENGVTKTGLLLPVEIVDCEKVPVSELVVADMEESLTDSGELIIDEGVNTGFDGDPDRFYIRIPGLPANHTVKVKLSTVENPGSSYDDDPTEIELYYVEGGYESKSQVLVSGTIDAEIATLENITPDNPEPSSRHKRTHNIQLGGKVRITDLVIDGTPLPLDLKIPVPIKKTVKLNFVAINDAETPDIAAELKSANEIYASTGIRLEMAGAPVTRPPLLPLPEQSPNSVILADDVSNYGRYISHYGSTNSVADIHVFYVMSCKDSDGRPYQGFSIIADTPGTTLGPSGPNSNQTGDANNLFIGNIHAEFVTLAHELCHVLTNMGHYGSAGGFKAYNPNAPSRKESHNLMDGDRSSSEIDRITAKKRIYEEQRIMIFSHWTTP